MPDRDIAGVTVASVTGSQSAVPKDVLSAMRDSGLAHLLSVSGLHVGLVAGILPSSPAGPTKKLNLQPVRGRLQEAAALLTFAEDEIDATTNGLRRYVSLNGCICAQPGSPGQYCCRGERSAPVFRQLAPAA